MTHDLKLLYIYSLKSSGHDISTYISIHLERLDYNAYNEGHARLTTGYHNYYGLAKR